MIKKALLLLSLTITPLLVTPSVVLAVDPFKNVCDNSANTGSGGNSADSAVCKDKNVGNENPLYGSDGVLTSIIALLSAVVAIVAVIGIILAGIKFIGSGDNPQEVSKAREMVIYAAVALFVAGLAQALVRFVIGKL